MRVTGPTMSELAIDTATAACAVALRVDGETFDHAPAPGRMLERPAHAKELLPAIESLCNESGTELAELTSIAVGVGPGAFTGLRIGVSTARAIATANGLGLVPVSSLETLIAGGGTDQTVIAMIDARRNEVFYRVGEGPDSLASPAETLSVVRDAVARGSVLAIGDGALKFREQLFALGAEVPSGDDDRHVVNATMMLDIAASQTPLAPEAVTPNYIRAPDAKVSSRESWLVESEAQ